MKKTIISLVVVMLSLVILTSGALAGRWIHKVGHDPNNPDSLIIAGDTPRQQYTSDNYDYLEVVIDVNGNGRIDYQDGSYIEEVSGEFFIQLDVSEFRGRLAEITLWNYKHGEILGNEPGYVKRRGYSVSGSHDSIKDYLQ